MTSYERLLAAWEAWRHVPAPTGSEIDALDVLRVDLMAADAWIAHLALPLVTSGDVIPALGGHVEVELVEIRDRIDELLGSAVGDAARRLHEYRSYAFGLSYINALFELVAVDRSGPARR